MRTTILTSIVVSQLDFVSAYTIFVVENLRVRHPVTFSFDGLYGYFHETTTQELRRAEYLAMNIGSFTTTFGDELGSLRCILSPTEIPFRPFERIAAPF